MPEPLKNLYSRSFVSTLAAQIAEAHGPFDVRAFERAVLDRRWSGRELKDRMDHIARCLRVFLPEDYGAALRVLLRVCRKHRSRDMGFTDMLFPHFVEAFGLERPDLSLPALEEFTKGSSAEFAIRRFYIRDPKQVLAQLLVWSGNTDPAVRRLASEGCRPRLPWAVALKDLQKDPQPILPILDRLKADESESVRRSVANNINDISKDHPDIVLDLIERWVGQDPKTDWILRHGARGLLRRGHPRALSLLGFQTEGGRVSRLRADVRVRVGGAFSFAFTYHPPGPGRHRLAFAIDYVKGRGTTSRKTFHLRTLSVEGARPIAVEKSVSFKDLSTRRHHPGKHALHIVANGRILASKLFAVVR